jgi:hypothetical protein
LYTRSRRCLDVHELLDRVRRLLGANIANLDQWIAREKNRSFQPRWSEKDELKHGNMRDQQNLRVKKQISLLKDQAQKLKDSIKRTQSLRLVVSTNADIFETEANTVFSFSIT